jgi:hypothetical protein
MTADNQEGQPQLQPADKYALARIAYVAYRTRALEMVTVETAHMLPEEFELFIPEWQDAWLAAAVAVGGEVVKDVVRMVDSVVGTCSE